MSDLLSGGVTRGLVGAAVSMETAKVCMAVYSAAKARNDEAAMERALGYASDNMAGAMGATQEARTALAENIDAARDEEKADQAARLKKARQDAAEKRAEAQQNANTESADNNAEPKDVIEISSEAYTALQNEHSGVEEQRVNTQIADMKIDGGETEKIKYGTLDIKL